MCVDRASSWTEPFVTQVTFICLYIKHIMLGEFALKCVCVCMCVYVHVKVSYNYVYKKIFFLKTENSSCICLLLFDSFVVLMT